MQEKFDTKQENAVDDTKKDINFKKHVLKERENRGFTQLDNDVISGKIGDLSIEALGLLLKNLSLPSNWHYSSEWMYRQTKLSQHKFQKAKKELIDKGFYEQIKTRIGGKWLYQYIIYEVPKEYSKSLKESIENDELKSTNENEYTENDPYINKNKINKNHKKESNKEKEKSILSDKSKDIKTTKEILSYKQKNFKAIEDFLQKNISDKELRKLLFSYFQSQFEKNKTISLTQATALVENLCEKSDDPKIQKEMVRRSLQQGWQNFYLPNDKYNRHETKLKNVHKKTKKTDSTKQPKVFK